MCDTKQLVWDHRQTIEARAVKERTHAQRRKTVATDLDHTHQASPYRSYTLRSSDARAPCRSQQTGQQPLHFVALSLGNAIAVQLASVGIPAVIIGDGDADNPLGLAVVTSDDHFLATVDHPPNWFVVSISFDLLVLGARSGQDFRSLSWPRGYGDSSTQFGSRSSIDSSMSPSPL